MKAGTVKHTHQSGIANDVRIVGGSGISVEFERQLEFVGVLAPEQTKTFEVAGMVKSIGVSAAVDGVPTANCEITIGDEVFGMSKGPLQWRSGGHLGEDMFVEAIDQIVVTNKESSDVRLSLIVGFDPVTAEVETEAVE